MAATSIPYSATTTGTTTSGSAAPTAPDFTTPFQPLSGLWGHHTASSLTNVGSHNQYHHHQQPQQQQQQQQQHQIQNVQHIHHHPQNAQQHPNQPYHYSYQSLLHQQHPQQQVHSHHQFVPGSAVGSNANGNAFGQFYQSKHFPTTAAATAAASMKNTSAPSVLSTSTGVAPSAPVNGGSAAVYSIPSSPSTTSLAGGAAGLPMSRLSSGSLPLNVSSTSLNAASVPVVPSSAVATPTLSRSATSSFFGNSQQDAQLQSQQAVNNAAAAVAAGPGVAKDIWVSSSNIAAGSSTTSISSVATAPQSATTASSGSSIYFRQSRAASVVPIMLDDFGSSISTTTSGSSANVDIASPISGSSPPPIGMSPSVGPTDVTPGFAFGSAYRSGLTGAHVTHQQQQPQQTASPVFMDHLRDDRKESIASGATSPTATPALGMVGAISPPQTLAETNSPDAAAGLHSPALSAASTRRSSGNNNASSDASAAAKAQKKLKVTTNTELYKTELCVSFMNTSGNCPYGDKCQFAHGEKELKRVDRPPKWRSKPCQNWLKNGSCSYNDRCCFRHDVSAIGTGSSSS